MITDISQLDLNKKYSYADYLTWQLDEMVEIIKGKIYRMSPAPRRIHQEVSGNIFYYFKDYFKNKTCKIYEAPFDVRLVKKIENEEVIFSVVQPDLSIICDNEKLDDHGCKGSPDLIIEIISKTSKKRDYHDKFMLYQENQVKEYWIADPYSKSIDLFYLENNTYLLDKTYTEEDKSIRSITFKDLIINLNDIFTF